MSILRNSILKGSGIAIFLLLWEVAPREGWADAQFLPPLSTVLATIYQLGMDGDLSTHIIVSLWRALVGLLLAALIALPLGFILEGWFPKLNSRLNSFFRLMSHVNPFSLAPVFLLLFGIGETEKLAVITLVAFWPILFHTITGVRTVDPLLIKTAHSLNVSDFVLARDVILPAAFPTIITGLRVGAQITTFMLIGVEMLGAHAGLGWLVHNSAMLYQIPRMYAAGTLIILLGVLFNQMLLKLEKDSLFWQTPLEILDNPSADKDSTVPSRFYVPVMIGILAGVLIFGGREVQQINLQGVSGPVNGTHYQSNSEQQEDKGMHHDKEGMPHDMEGMSHDMKDMPGHSR